MPTLIDITGRKFGKLTVVSKGAIDSGRSLKWVCKCECGSEVSVRGSSLRNGKATSCGCSAHDIKHTYPSTHPLMVVWYSMNNRCHNRRNRQYKDYGGRGIHVCKAWRKDADSFANWATNNGWQPGLQIERVDNDDGYHPENCTFKGRKEQARNKRSTLLVPYEGKLVKFIELVEMFSTVSRKVAYDRIYRYGWNVLDAVSIPTGERPDE